MYKKFIILFYASLNLLSINVMKIIQILKRTYLLLKVLRIKGYRQLLFMKLDKDLPIIDIGANRGQSAAIFWLRGIEVYCYEPHPKAFARLESYFADVKKIHTINAAIVSEFVENNGFIDLYLHEDQESTCKDLSQASSLMQDKMNVQRNNYIRVKTLVYSSILETAKRFSLLKCDIEGYEYILYKDMLKYSDFVEYFFLETHANKNPHWKDKQHQLEDEFATNIPSYRFNLDWH